MALLRDFKHSPNTEYMYLSWVQQMPSTRS